ncbi:hypothetical protein DH2020_034352 [Rehmannia glutinosa]|uniref:Serine carboxypeptidase-like protein n=1 Tax=Rehmannia glutinosa TaxID=99300 RepID=A0ABR0V9Q1_REHGL
MDVFFMLLLIISFLCHPSSLLGNGESTTLAARTHRKHDLIHSLPGQPKQRPGFKQYGGYVTVDVSKEEAYITILLKPLPSRIQSRSFFGLMEGLVARRCWGLWLRSVHLVLIQAESHFTQGDLLGTKLKMRMHSYWAGSRDSHITKHGIFTSPEKVMQIGNGLLNDETDTRGINDFLWSHALISDEAYHRYAQYDIGKLDPYDIYAPVCNSSSLETRPCMDFDPCESDYIHSYFNLPAVQKALHANKTKLPYTWEVCSSMVGMNWRNGPSSMFPIYRRLMSAGLRILLYSGDVDSIIPVTSTRYSIAAMGLRVKKPWIPWYAGDSNEVAGYRVIYDGLSFATVRGAGHLVPQSKPSRAFCSA